MYHHSVEGSSGEEEYEDGKSKYPSFLYKFGLFLFPYLVSNPFQVALIFQQIQYTPSVFSKRLANGTSSGSSSRFPDVYSFEERLLEIDNYCQNPSRTIPPPPSLSIDSLGYVETPKERVIGTCVLEDGSLLPTVIIGSRGITSVDLTSCSLSMVMRILSNHFGVRVLWRGLANYLFYSISRSFIKGSLSTLIDSFLFHHFLSLTDATIEITSELTSSVASSLLLLPLEMANIRYVIQSRVPTEQKYRSIFSCLVGMHVEEGGIFSSVYKYLGMSSFFFYLSSAAFTVSKNLLLSKAIAMLIDENSNIPPWVSLVVLFSFPFLLDIIQVAIFQPFHIARLRLMSQFRPPQNKLFVENSPSSASNASSLVPFYYWSGISPTSNAEPILVRKLSVVRPFIVGTYLSPKPYCGLWDAMVRIYHEEGLKALYSGWRYRLFALAFRTLPSLISIEHGDEYGEDDYGSNASGKGELPFD